MQGNILKNNLNRYDMNNEYQEIDKLITEALTSDEAKYFKELEEQSLPQQVFGLYKGKMKWITL